MTCSYEFWWSEPPRSVKGNLYIFSGSFDPVDFKLGMIVNTWTASCPWWLFESLVYNYAFGELMKACNIVTSLTEIEIFETQHHDNFLWCLHHHAPFCDTLFEFQGCHSWSKSHHVCCSHVQFKSRQTVYCFTGRTFINVKEIQKEMQRKGVSMSFEWRL